MSRRRDRLAEPAAPSDLKLSEVPVARRAYALKRARPWLSTAEISARLARDHGINDAPRKPFRTKRLRLLIRLYESCMDAGVDPAPETIFD